MAIKRSDEPRQDAEAIGLAALVFMTEDGERLGRFLRDTGLTPAELKGLAGTPEGLAAVLDHLLADESLLLVFTAGAGIEPAVVAPAREALAGGNRTVTDAPAQRKPSRRWPGPGA